MFYEHKNLGALEEAVTGMGQFARGSVTAAMPYALTQAVASRPAMAKSLTPEWSKAPRHLGVFGDVDPCSAQACQALGGQVQKAGLSLQCVDSHGNWISGSCKGGWLAPASSGAPVNATPCKFGPTKSFARGVVASWPCWDKDFNQMLDVCNYDANGYPIGNCIDPLLHVVVGPLSARRENLLNALRAAALAGSKNDRNGFIEAMKGIATPGITADQLRADIAAAGLTPDSFRKDLGFFISRAVSLWSPEPDKVTQAIGDLGPMVAWSYNTLSGGSVSRPAWSTMRDVGNQAKLDATALTRNRETCADVIETSVVAAGVLVGGAGLQVAAVKGLKPLAATIGKEALGAAGYSKGLYVGGKQISGGSLMRLALQVETSDGGMQGLNDLAYLGAARPRKGDANILTVELFLSILAMVNQRKARGGVSPLAQKLASLASAPVWHAPVKTKKLKGMDEDEAASDKRAASAQYQAWILAAVVGGAVLLKWLESKDKK